MRPLRKLLKAKKGSVGIEAAIVVIAFVVIAAAVSYVVINMGFFATQKTKETIASGMQEATSALQLDGSVIAKTETGANITHLLVPVKLSVGKSPLDLSGETVVASIYLPNATLLDIYNGTSTATDWTSLMNDVGRTKRNSQSSTMTTTPCLRQLRKLSLQYIWVMATKYWSTMP